jgi:hypothetical protein
MTGTIRAAFVASFTAVGALAVGHGVAKAQAITVPIESGWYVRADKVVRGVETNLRCLCAEGFSGKVAPDDKFFEVVRAPEGYSDTIGRRFNRRQIYPINAMD